MLATTFLSRRNKIFTTKILSTELFVVLFTEMEVALGKEKFYLTWNRYSSSGYHFPPLAGSIAA